MGHSRSRGPTLNSSDSGPRPHATEESPEPPADPRAGTGAEFLPDAEQQSGPEMHGPSVQTTARPERSAPAPSSSGQIPSACSLRRARARKQTVDTQTITNRNGEAGRGGALARPQPLCPRRLRPCRRSSCVVPGALEEHGCKRTGSHPVVRVAPRPQGDQGQTCCSHDLRVLAVLGRVPRSLVGRGGPPGAEPPGEHMRETQNQAQQGHAAPTPRTGPGLNRKPPPRRRSWWCFHRRRGSNRT